MINDPEAFLNYFRSIHRRTLRDVVALPDSAERWEPTVGEGENGWGISKIVQHIAESRVYFASAYTGNGWRYDWNPHSTEQKSSWVDVLEASAVELQKHIAGTPSEWLERRIKMIDTDGTLSGWRILMMLLEHEVHHRSQIDTYAGLEGWDVPQIYGRTREQIDELQNRQ